MNTIYSKGKALYIDKETIYIAKGYKIYKVNRKNKKVTFDGQLLDPKYSIISHLSRLLNRLLRIEPSSMLILPNKNKLIIAKKGIFIATTNNKKYVKTFNIPRGNKPLNIVLNPNNGHLYFGEYILNGKFSDKNRSEVNIYKSEDNGQNWKVCYTFPKNTIRHIHGIFYDKYTKKLWITTGDKDNECLIASTSNEFESLEIFKQGAQKYRAVTLLFYPNNIVYGTDTEHEVNYIYSIQRETGEETCLQKLQGSVLMGVQDISGQAAISTAVEPSKINNHPYAHIWFSHNGSDWKDIYAGRKDFWDAKYFQYGKITFPQNAINAQKLYFTGHALQGIDNQLISIENY